LAPPRTVTPPALDLSRKSSNQAHAWHTKGGFYHDGRFPTLLDVVNHYSDCKSLGLSEQEKSDLVQFLMSLPIVQEEGEGHSALKGETHQQ